MIAQCKQNNTQLMCSAAVLQAMSLLLFNHLQVCSWCVQEVEDNSAGGSVDPDQPGSSKAGSVEQSTLTASSLIAASTEAFALPICGICMESTFRSSGPHNGCNSIFCSCCLRKHVETQVSGKKWPVICPAVDCGAVLSMADCCKVVYDPAQLRKVRQ